MEDLIKKIIEVDKQARNKTEKSKQKLIEAKEEIQKRKEELAIDYEKSYKEALEITCLSESEKVAELKAEIDHKFDVINQQLDQSFCENKDAWVKQLVEQTLS